MSGAMQTFTGRTFFPLQPRLEDIVIADIAHALALQCRFAGHVRLPYSVAQHSVLVSLAVPPADALWGLLHDASEAYLVDVPRPLKRLPLFAPYRVVEAMLQRTIYSRFGLAGEEPASVRDADDLLLVSEACDLLPTGPGPSWPDAVRSGQAPRTPKPIVPWTPAKAERAFLDRFQLLTEGRV